MRKLNFLHMIVKVSLLGLSLTILPCCDKGYDLPVVMTLTASDIKASSAHLGGQIISDGGAEVTSRGVCWGTKPGPDVTDSRIKNGRGTGSYVCILTGLDQNTHYFARAYATNSEGIAYGEDVQFFTITGSKPEVEVIALTPGYFGIFARVRIKNDGGLPITGKGICLSTYENPTVNDIIYIADAGTPEVSGFSLCYVEKLNPKTTYHLRAYAINASGISYGDDKSVTTLAVPEVSTDIVTEITNNSATISGDVTSMGDAFGRIEIGVCYGTEQDPARFGHIVKSGTYVTGKFTCYLTNLASGKLYFVRTYVAWDYDNDWEWFNCIVYGNEESFTTKN
jgi:hypothetical protein